MKKGKSRHLSMSKKRKDFGRLATEDVKLHAWVKATAKKAKRTIPKQVEYILETAMHQDGSKIV